MSGLVPFNRRRADIMSTGFDDFQNMLDDFFAEGWPLRRSLAGDTFKIDVQDNENEYIIEAELPGVAKEEVNVSLDDGRLKIAVNKEENIEREEKNYIHRERRCTAMARNVFLANPDPEGIKAKLDNGVLTVQVPKKAKPESKIEIEVG